MRDESSDRVCALVAKIDSHAGKVNIGGNCHITYGSVILSHDGAAKQMRADDDGAGAVIIGNNVFVGVNAVILRNVRIGDNSVIGAGAVVTGDIPANSLVVGNRRRCSGRSTRRRIHSIRSNTNRCAG